MEFEEFEGSIWECFSFSVLEEERGLLIWEEVDGVDGFEGVALMGVIHVF